MKLLFVASLASGLAVSGCAMSNVQPMAQDTFKVSTEADAGCGANGARNVAFRTASIEVIRRGGDKFIIVDDQTSSNNRNERYNQGMVVKVVSPGSADYSNALSARAQLGPEWRTIVDKGASMTCLQ